MVYNSQKELLVIPEYGRNVQNLIRYARQIPDVKQRQAFVEEVVELMMEMHPQNRNLEDYRTKMWKHVFRIAEYNLPDVVPPNGIIPTPEDIKKKPQKVSYPHKDTKFKHYGYNVLTLIEKALSMEDGPVKDGFVQVIGSYMKLAYRTWNKEHYISDDVIIADLESISGGKLKLVEDGNFDSLTQTAPPQKRRKRNGGTNKSDDRSNKNGGRRRRDRSSRGGDNFKRRRR
ncbi:MAG: DUF4290 domain-containing protein [Bacteroidetes bacterium]|nr:MAG: DUF4290 domain-containing protein [Bacteroidota bacterium]